MDLEYGTMSDYSIKWDEPYRALPVTPNIGSLSPTALRGTTVKGASWLADGVQWIVRLTCVE